MLACHAGGPGSIPGQCNFSIDRLHDIIRLIETYFAVTRAEKWPSN